ncbi:MAG: methenyltetrahydromethanopterin cyclohydrolase [Planctomycetaceae bacterium]
MSLNADARRVAALLVADADRLGVAVHTVGESTVVDCGVAAPGSHEAGLLVARAAMADRGTVRLSPPGVDAPWPGSPWPTVAVGSDDPVTACLAAQYAGWKVAEGSFFAMASGPFRALCGREALFDGIGRRESDDVAVAVLECSRLPPPTVCARLAADAGVAPSRLFVLVARTASPVGTLQVIARSLETALHRLHVEGFDLARVVRGRGRAPLAPVAGDDLAAIGLTNDAILYGGQVVLEVRGDDGTLERVGPRIVSRGSPAYGAPFREIFAAAGGDFYAIDPALFAPAAVEFVNVDSGRRHPFGAVDPALVARCFAEAEG